MRFSIKIGVPKEEEKENWGDYHFAKGLKKELEKRGYRCYVDVLSDWYENKNEEVVIVLRGLKKYKPSKKHLNIIWNISHPDLISDEEFRAYDIIFIASNTYAKKISKKIGREVFPLLQCTDPELFYPCTVDKKNDLLFVGNSRGVYRKILRDLNTKKYDLSVYGRYWEKFIDKKFIKSNYCSYERLKGLYCSCKILLNDHWSDMREKGFINNRIFDALACKTFMISDYLPEIKEEFGDSVVMYYDKKDLDKKISIFLNNPDLRERIVERGHLEVLKNHTFKHRVDMILEKVKEEKKSLGIRLDRLRQKIRVLCQASKNDWESA